ncbi:ABC transporter ATP-binding protein/permease [bacterium]|nr:ABC transporter ATP-binding protein/permease [bacterium]
MLKILKTFYRFVLKKRLVATAFFATIIAAPLVEGILPLYYKLFVDEIPNLNYDKLLSILIAYIGIRIVILLLHTITRFLGDSLVIPAVADLKETVFTHLHDLDFSFHTNKSSGSLISAIKRGDGAFWNFHNSIHFRLVNVLVSFFVMLYFFRLLDIRIAFLAILSFLLALVITAIFVKKNVKTRATMNKQEDKISGVIVDNMINFETVKLFAKEVWEKNRLKNIHKDWINAVWKFANTFRALDLAMGTVINTSIFLLLFFSLKLTLEKTITTGDFVLVVGFASFFYPKVFEMVWGFRDMAKGYSDLRRYFGLLDNQVEVKDPVKSVKIKRIVGEIEYKNTSFSYGDSKVDAISNINLQIRPGQSVALVGKSGAGKTTIVKLLMRFSDVTKGEIKVDRVNIKKLKKSHLRSFMGVVPQEPVLFNNTIGYNIAYGRENATKREIKAAAKLANIHDFIISLADGYKTKVGERGIKLSGGQKQRVAIARMILSDPEIVIFDEATSQLDSESEKLIQEAFWKAVKNKTTIIIAHRLSTVMRADKIVVMEDGKIVEVGSHNELIRKKGGHYKHFWDLQTIE